jgi:tetratricopeptide (TPR) repeat protein
MTSVRSPRNATAMSTSIRRGAIAARRFFLLFLVTVVTVLVGRGAFAQTTDRVVTSSGTVSGRVTATDANQVQLEDRAGEMKKIAIDQIREVQFGGEPAELKSARSMLLRGRAADSLEELAKIEPTDLDGAEQILLDEVDYVRAAATARVALAAGGDPREAGKLVADFVAKHPDSHHAYDMQELLGDLLARAGRVDNALAAFGQLAKGPPAFKVRAASARAAMLLDQGKYAESLREFDAAVQIDASDEASAAQKRAAELGRARCLAQLGKPEEAVGLVQTVIQQADPEDGEVLGRAYNALGQAYRAVAGKEQDALIAFLTVDLVYNKVPENHAEALYNLVDLWEKGANPERSREARATLESTYPGSQWAKKLTAGKS